MTGSNDRNLSAMLSEDAFSEADRITRLPDYVRNAIGGAK